MTKMTAGTYMLAAMNGVHQLAAATNEGKKQRGLRHEVRLVWKRDKMNVLKLMLAEAARHERKVCIIANTWDMACALKKQVPSDSFTVLYQPIKGVYPPVPLHDVVINFDLPKTLVAWQNTQYIAKHVCHTFIAVAEHDNKLVDPNVSWLSRLPDFVGQELPELEKFLSGTVTNMEQQALMQFLDSALMTSQPRCRAKQQDMQQKQQAPQEAEEEGEEEKEEEQEDDDEEEEEDPCRGNASDANVVDVADMVDVADVASGLAPCEYCEKHMGRTTCNRCFMSVTPAMSRWWTDMKVPVKRVQTICCSKVSRGADIVMGIVNLFEIIHREFYRS